MVKKNWVLLIILASVLWSLDGLLRRNLYTLTPIIVVFYEHLIGFLLLIPFLVPKLHLLRTLNRKDWGAFLWVSVLSGVGGTLLYTTALGQVNFISYSVVVLLQQVEPLIVMIFASKVLKESITKEYVAWASVAIFGAIFLSLPNLTVNISQNTGHAIAALLAIGAAFCWGSSTAFSRYALQKVPAHVATGVRFGLTTIISLGFVYLFGASSVLTQITSAQRLNLLGIALSTGMVGMLIYYNGLRFTQAKVSAIAELFWPFSAVFVGYFFLGDRLTITQVIGAIALLVAMYKINSSQKIFAAKSA